MARVVLEQLTKSFKGPGGGIRAVNNLSLTAESGELLVLVGPSGCGKTTTLRLIAGLEEVESGTISIDGKAMKGVMPKDREVAMVFQNHALYPHLTARENMAFGLKLRRQPAAEIAASVNQAAEMLGLRNCLDRRPEALSGGERQRVALGRALVRRPKVFLLDEPLSDLDAPKRAQMRREIARLHEKLGATMIYVTHDQVEAMTLGDRIAVMNKGEVQQTARPMELYQQPANRFVAGFIGSPAMNFFSGTFSKNGSGLVFEAGEIKLRVDAEMAGRFSGQAGKKVVLGIRPEHIREGGDGLPGENAEAVAEAVEALGAETHLHASICGHPFVARLRADSQAAAREKVSLNFDMRRAHFFDASTEKRISA